MEYGERHCPVIVDIVVVGNGNGLTHAQRRAVVRVAISLGKIAFRVFSGFGQHGRLSSKPWRRNVLPRNENDQLDGASSCYVGGLQVVAE